MKLSLSVYLLIGLVLSLFLNAWQWQNKSGKTAAAAGVLTLCTNANDSVVKANTAAYARMWECVGESTKDLKAVERTALARATSDAQRAAADQAHQKELSNAYQNQDCSDWGDRPVCPAVSRLYDKAGREGRAAGSAGTGPKAVPPR